ncbi:transcriptional activator protein acu-15 [Triangularia setosa]|uniref:Transcriptional activator protein acu-15 n=1 Tax=Triangularia setosa TaxID=2587417 RepID=A0AAN6W8D8_9PEZI|nr:transcriptional activator protein acu-15 [Podospora setosa]
MSDSDAAPGQSNGNTAPASPPHGAAVTPLPLSPASTTPHERPRPPPNRRRDKPQLSCNSCRRRKYCSDSPSPIDMVARCDRQQPCNTCLSRGLALSCAYNPEAPTPQGANSTKLGSMNHSSTDRPRTAVQDRIQELERLVVTLMQQQHVPHLPQPLAPSSSFDSPVSSRLTLSAAYTPALNPIPPPPPQPPALPQLQDPATTTPSVDLGRISSDGVSYVGDAHWAAVLDSIAELKEHLDAEDSYTLVPSDDEEPSSAPASHLLPPRTTGPMLLYGCPTRASHHEILASIPVRPVVDRLISKYFNALDMAPALLHSGQFLSQYENFWQDPPATPVVWVGLLFTMMCLATQAQHEQSTPASLDVSSMTVKTFRERAVQCLIMGKYTKAGPFVLETLILYLTIELYLCEDAEFGIYLLLGIIVHLAMRMGYHRDPKHFSGISPFEGEIRRRVWATIYQVDLGISAQMGLPRMIKERQMDTELPRNLLDLDFGESTGALPPSRPDTDVTPMLYVLAKNRLASIGGAICDLVTDIQPCPYEKVMRIDQSLQQARMSLPPSLAWRPLTQSITCSAQVILQRVWLDIYLLHLQIILHKRHCFAPIHQRQPEPYPYSEKACLTAAIKILEYQCLIDDETQSPDGQLYQVRWKMSSLFNYHFLLATSILCSFFRGESSNKTSSQTLDSVGGHEKIRELLRRSLDVWLRSSSSSKEAKKAAKALRLILRDTDASLTSGDTPLSETILNISGLPSVGFDWTHDSALSATYMSNMAFPFTMLTSMTTDTNMTGFGNAGTFDMTGDDEYY